MGDGDGEERPDDWCVAPFMPVAHETLWTAVAGRGIGPESLVIDLGSGDGRVLEYCASTFGCTCIGVERDPALVVSSRASSAGSSLIRIDDQDMREGAWRDEALRWPGGVFVVVHLLPECLATGAVRDGIEALHAAGATVIAFRFEMPDWEPKETESAAGFTVYGHARPQGNADRAELLFDDR